MYVLILFWSHLFGILGFRSGFFLRYILIVKQHQIETVIFTLLSTGQPRHEVNNNIRVLVEMLCGVAPQVFNEMST